MDPRNHSHDVGRVTAPVEDPGRLVEDLTVRFEPRAASAAWMVIEWERSRVRVPVRLDPDGG